MDIQIRNRKRIILLICAICIISILYLFWDLDLTNMKYVGYALKLRGMKWIVMLFVSFCIGFASLIFQTIIQNRIVTPCLLGMNTLYTLIHTLVFFLLGSKSIFVHNIQVRFLIDIVLMGICATTIYYMLFKKVKYNILYILLIGSILSSFFSSVQTSMIRVMDPNAYDSLLATLVASFSNVQSEILMLSFILLIGIIWFIKDDLKQLDVLSLGKNQAINLGVDYDKCISRLLLGVTLCIAIATALVGPISFLGLIIANLARQLVKTYRHTYLILTSICMGIFVLMSGEFIVSHIYDYTIPISVFITIAGGIYFLYLLIRDQGVK